MSFPRYEAYKDSGVEWLGDVPKDWTVCALSYRYEVQLGKMLDEKRITGEHLGPYLRNVDVQWGSVNVVDLPQMDFRDVDLVRFSLVPGDLLVCEGGEVGRAAIWKGEIEPCFYQKALHRLRCIQSRKDTAQFLYYVMFAAAKLGVFSGSEGKATIVHLPAEALRRYHFAFPSLPEQTTIATFLDRETEKIDALVEQQQRLIALLKEKRQAVISHAVTKGLDPNAPMKDSGVEWLGEVPAHWEVLPLKRDLEFLTSGSRGWAEHYSDDGALFIRIGNLTRDGLSLDFSDIQRVTVPEGAEGERTRVRPGDLLFSITAYLGSVAVVSDDIEAAYVSQHVALARLRHQHFLPQWVGFVTLSWMGRTYLETQGYGGTKIQLSLDDISCMPITAPPLVEQGKILACLENEITKLSVLSREAEAAIALLQERRSALVSAAVTGKIDVRGLAPSQAEAA